VLGVQATGRRELALPFDPAEVWGRRDRYHVTGTIDGNPVRGPLSSVAGGWVLPVGALWCQDPRFTEPTEVAAELRFEGPQRDHLADDVAEALAAHPDAAAFWDSLATFYRKGYLRWIDATKRRPELLRSSQEPEPERREHEDDADVHQQAFPEVVPEEEDVHADHDGDQRQHVERDDASLPITGQRAA
jgi:hypothetical protein